MSLTRRGIVSLVAAAGCQVVALAADLPFLTFAAVLLVALVAAAAVDVVITPRRIDGTRAVHPVVVESGHDVRVRIDLSGTTPEATWHDGEYAGEGSCAEYVVRCQRRGMRAIGPLVVDVEDHFGLVRRSVEVAAPDSVLVTPRILALDDLMAGRLDPRGEDSEASRVGGGGQDDLVARPYVSGDETRRLHWKATARRGRLMVRQEEDRDHPRVLVALDTAATVHDTEPDRDGWSPSPSFERAVSAAASLVRGLAESGYDVTLRAGTDLRIVVPAGRGTDGAAQRALAEIAPEQYLDRRVLALDAGRGSTIVVTGRVDARSSRDLVNAFGEGDVIVLATQLPESVRTTLAEAGWRA